GGSGGGRRGCRRRAPGPGPTISGSSTGRRRGTSPPGRGSASRARPRGHAGWDVGSSFALKLPKAQPDGNLDYGFVVVSLCAEIGATVSGLSVRTIVCAPPAPGLSC